MVSKPFAPTAQNGRTSDQTGLTGDSSAWTGLVLAMQGFALAVVGARPVPALRAAGGLPADHAAADRLHHPDGRVREPPAARLDLTPGRDTGATLGSPTMSRAFPEGFRWGTATAAHQVEGGNVNNDWWAWEQHARARAASSPAATPATSTTATRPTCDLLAALGFNSYRFSIEWSRIEPEEGQFSNAALDHYRRVCAACLAHGVDPVVTFHHFTTPRWAAADGGWSNPAIVDRFGRFCEAAGDAPGRPDHPGLHHQRAQHRELPGLLRRRVPARASATGTAGRRPATTSRRATAGRSTCSSPGRATSRWA